MDLNQLMTLDVLLDEGSVAAAARRLRLSPSAMSRALARLRASTGDPLLVRAGRGLVPTPRAIELRAQVGPLVEAAQALLRPQQALDPKHLVRTFTLRTREGFVENFGAQLVAAAQAAAPGVRLCFLSRPDQDSTALREGTVDLETGVVGKSAGPELRMRALFKDRFVGVVRTGHQLSRAGVTAKRYASARHIDVSRQGHTQGPIERAMAAAGLARDSAVIVGSFASALALAAGSDLVASVPERQTSKLREGLHSFSLPFPIAGFTVSMLWHPRQDADPAHRWLRSLMMAVCAPTVHPQN